MASNQGGGALGSQPWLSLISRYSQDNINAAIERFADPAFHRELMFAQHPLAFSPSRAKH
jgi:hypothetical protein